MKSKITKKSPKAYCSVCGKFIYSGGVTKGKYKMHRACVKRSRFA
jgi:hypothetical protein